MDLEFSPDKASISLVFSSDVCLSRQNLVNNQGQHSDTKKLKLEHENVSVKDKSEFTNIPPKCNDSKVHVESLHGLTKVPAHFNDSVATLVSDEFPPVNRTGLSPIDTVHETNLRDNPVSTPKLNPPSCTDLPVTNTGEPPVFNFAHVGPLIDEENDSDVPLDENEQKAAEDIVRKLCRNGKLMEFQEGEDFIKVIVYEDSQEDDNDTQSADESDQMTHGKQRTLGGRGQSRNLLDCLTEHGKENETSTPIFPTKLSNEATLGSSQVVLPSNSLPNITQTFPLPAMPIALASNQQLYNTPHPCNGYMYYTESPAVTTQAMPRQATRHRTPGMTPTSSRMKTPGSKPVQLNSSGEEISPSDPLAAPSSEQPHNRVRSIMHLSQFQEDSGKVREQHNQKERRRRARIKEACNLLRQLVPGMSEKTDKATVFEFAARYVHFLKSHTGAQYDKDFLMKYSPY